MNIDELAQKLEKMFNSGENKNAMTQLFMIIYYDEITRLCQKEFYSINSFSGKTYYIELKKGYKLAKYVKVRTEYINHW